jgi:hypothetical protein
MGVLLPILHIHVRRHAIAAAQVFVMCGQWDGQDITVMKMSFS